MKKKNLILIIAGILVAMIGFSCNQIDFDLPHGPKGNKGASAYDIWKMQVLNGSVDWPKENIDLSDYMRFMKGEKGADGRSTYELWKELISKGDVVNPHDKNEKWDPKKNTQEDFWNFMIGRDGQTPYIGDNNNWFIGGKDTGVPATGANGLSAYEQWKKSVEAGEITKDGKVWSKGSISISDFFRYLKGKDGKDGKDGLDGQDASIPHIGVDGYWYIGETNTGVKAQGDKGDKGDKGDAGANGLSAYELWKNDVAAGTIQDKNGEVWPQENNSQADFYKYLKGDKGDKGADGLSAYDLWKEMISSGNVDNPHNTKEKWDSNKNTQEDFWNFMIGRDGHTPYIGENNNWFIGGKDTGVLAVGKDGLSAYEQWKKSVEAGEITKDGKVWSTESTSMSDFFRYLKGKDGANGLDGQTPHIGDDGYWYIGETKTTVKAQGDKGDKGDAGDTGANGLSAYELWKNDVAAGTIRDKNGEVWPKGKNSQEDFYKYLQGKDGKDGKDGKSAYEIWKELAETGDLDNPKAGIDGNGDKWPKDKISIADFYKYLTGKDGKSTGDKGDDGKSAYELWREDLAKKCGTPNALVNYNTGEPWPCSLNTIDDFYNYLRGVDPGDDGAITDGNDGHPGELGKPGNQTTIKPGFRNVIAQYAYTEYSEYVRPTDGGVEYIVYDEFGSVAPGAKVQGMPGINPDKVYTANEQGHFIVPREDLPWIEDVNSRWGKTAKVTIPGKGTKASARNTYVPNRVDVKLEFYKSPDPVDNPNTPYLNSAVAMRVKVLRQTSPNAEWETYPNYLTQIKFSYNYPIVDDKNKPKSRKNNLRAAGTTTPSELRYENGVAYGNIFVNRPILDKSFGNDNSQSLVVPPGETYYFTVVSNQKLYGQYLEWNGTCELVPHQAMPSLKTLKLKGRREEGGSVYFEKAEGEFDFSLMDFTKLYKRSLVKESSTTPGVTIFSGDLYTETEAKARAVFFVEFDASSIRGAQTATSQKARSSFNSPTFVAERVYLKSKVNLKNSVYAHENWFFALEHTNGWNTPEGGVITEVVQEDQYELTWKRAKYIPAPTVTYEN